MIFAIFFVGVSAPLFPLALSRSIPSTVSSISPMLVFVLIFASAPSFPLFFSRLLHLLVFILFLNQMKRIKDEFHTWICPKVPSIKYSTDVFCRIVVIFPQCV
ncbi:hypothetical protein AX774_g6214 [Zancudomyces culisetae]|uniref:Uncharacterized protein n=1 Tax=Zancudomyces culisetae TaxID=1213189 RepID=A0A1R1PHM1_ZANCU|nr:hypothetical protein AX774_g7283 [Zancudomyces culisetae]OMH80352.1 hypothetical protein AX774_g6214 [Zancudomyces culisetae]|eukprot:OMH79308.1 hypothetical protein AX774_g7283 [Zancudomyces culisetae]